MLHCRPRSSDKPCFPRRHWCAIVTYISASESRITLPDTSTTARWRREPDALELLHALLDTHQSFVTDEHPPSERLIHILDRGDDQGDEQRLNCNGEHQALAAQA